MSERDERDERPKLTEAEAEELQRGYASWAAVEDILQRTFREATRRKAVEEYLQLQAEQRQWERELRTPQPVTVNLRRLRHQVSLICDNLVAAAKTLDELSLVLRVLTEDAERLDRWLRWHEPRAGAELADEEAGKQAGQGEEGGGISH